MKKGFCKVALVLALVTAFGGISVSAATKPELVPNPIGTTEDSIAIADCLSNRADAMEVSAEAATPVDNAIKKLTKVAEYYGWKTTRTGKTKILPNKVLVATVNVTNSKYEFKGVEVRVTARKTVYVFGGYKYSLSSWKKTLKQYSTKADIKAVVVGKAKKAGNSLKKYGTARNWSCQVSNSYKGGKAAYKLKFRNKKYTFNVEVIATRKNGKITTSYKASGAKTGLKWIKSCLQNYRTSKKANSSADTMSSDLITLTPNGDSVMESASDEAFQSAAETDNDLQLDEATQSDSIELAPLDELIIVE